MIDTLLDYPEAPPPAESDLGTDASVLKYDDLIQDGRLRLDAAWRPTGRLLWRSPEVARVLSSMGDGATNVLSRVALQASEHVLEPRAAVETRVAYRFEHTIGKQGEVDRLLFSTWVSLYAKGRDGSLIPAGRSFGQRVFTHLSAAPGQHLITRLDGFGSAGVPPHRVAWQPALSLLLPPRDATLLDPVPRLDPARVVLGLSHTDLNQHVNFLVYHRAFESAALGRAVDQGIGSRLVSREAHIGYRKPCFAGEVVRVAVQAFRLGGAFGVIAAVVDDDGGPAARDTFRDFGSPRSVARMLLRP